jgi:hypothetical protein
VCELTYTKPQAIKCSLFCAVNIVVASAVMVLVHGMGF